MASNPIAANKMFPASFTPMSFFMLSSPPSAAFLESSSGLFPRKLHRLHQRRKVRVIPQPREPRFHVRPDQPARALLECLLQPGNPLFLIPKPVIEDSNPVRGDILG